MKTLSFALPLLAATLVASAQTSGVPSLLSYQGHVTDASGTPIGSDSPVNRAITFKFYDSSSGGTPLYAEAQTVTIASGDFSVLIGNGTGVSGFPGPGAPAQTPYITLPSLFEGNLYLGITVDDGTAAADAEIAPRQQIVSAAYAFRAKVAEAVADHALSTDMLADSAVTTNKIGASQVTTVKIADGNITTAKLANAGVTAAKLDTSTIGLWTPSGSHVYRPSGNVGIGQSSPGFPLNFASALGDKISLYGNSGAHYGLGVQSNLLQIYTNANSADVAFGYGTSTSFTETLRIKGNGNTGLGTSTPTEKLHVNGGNALIQNTSAPALKLSTGSATTDLGMATSSGQYSASAATGDSVLRASGKLHLQSGSGASALTIDASNRLGIGQPSPGFPLNFASALGNKIALHGNSGNHYGLGIQSSLLQIYTSGNTADVAFGYGSSTSFTETLRVKGNGRVTLGTTDTRARLNIGSVTATWDSFGRLTTNGGNSDNTTYTNQPLSIYATGHVLASQFDISSDARIKTGIQPSDGARDLDRLSHIRITDYRYKDELTGGSRPQKKVIAQQVEEVFPQAVAQRTGVIPDLYRKVEVKDGWVRLASDLKAGERVRLIDPTGDAVREVREVRPEAFRADLDPAVTEVFVYGREVPDLRSVDYDAISMLNVSATQELHRKVVTLETALVDKDARLAELEKRLKALEHLLSSSR